MTSEEDTGIGYIAGVLKRETFSELSCQGITNDVSLTVSLDSSIVDVTTAGATGFEFALGGFI